MYNEKIKNTQKKYKKKVRQFVAHFYLKDKEFYEEAKKEAARNGGINAYIKSLIRADLDKKKT